MSDADALARLPAKDIEVVLIEVDRLVKRARSGEPVAAPELSVVLSAGVLLRGTPVDYASNARVLLLRTGSEEVSYVPLSAIVALTAHVSPASAHLLSFGAMRERPAVAPSRLGLERDGAAIAAAVSEKIGRSFAVHTASTDLPRTEDARGALAVFLADLRQAFDDILSTPIGRDAVRDQFDDVSIGLGKVFSVRGEGRRLVVTLAAEGSDLGWCSRPELREAMERVL